MTKYLHHRPVHEATEAMSESIVVEVRQPGRVEGHEHWCTLRFRVLPLDAREVELVQDLVENPSASHRVDGPLCDCANCAVIFATRRALTRGGHWNWHSHRDMEGACNSTLDTVQRCGRCGFELATFRGKEWQGCAEVTRLLRGAVP